MMRRRGGERFEEAAQHRDAMRVVQAIRERQQKMATAELGDRDVFGVKVGTERRGHPGVPGAARPGRRAGRAVQPRPRGRRRARGASSAAALQQFYEEQVPPREVYVPAADRRRRRDGGAGCRRGPDARCASSSRSAATSAGWSTWRPATPSSPIAPATSTAGTAQAEALERLQPALQLPALPRRIECFDISTIQGSETVASMVVCEDGRMAKGEYRKFRVVGSRDPGSGRRNA